MPDDHTLTTFTTLFVEYPFVIQIEECIVDTYTADLVIDVISYNIGAPTLTSPKYTFEESPPCFYPETVTLTNLPPFVTHNEATSDFTIPQTSDLSLIGEYIVTLRSEISIPDDYTMTTYTTLFVEYDFIIRMEPCLVTTYTDTTKVTAIVYNIGAPSLTDGLYVFDEDPVCNYPETVTLTNLPAFVTHNEASSDFTIPQNNDLSLLGDYPVTLRSEICVPDDYTQATCTTFFVEYDFTVYVESCIITSYAATVLVPDITYNIGAPSLVNVGPYVFDEDPVCNYQETVTITGLPAFMVHNAPTSDDFSLPQNADLSLIGSYVVTIRSEI